MKRIFEQIQRDGKLVFYTVMVILSFFFISYFYNVHMLKTQILLLGGIAKSPVSTSMNLLLKFGTCFFIVQFCHFSAGYFVSKILPSLFNKVQNMVFRKINNIPLTFLNNTDGFVIGKQAETFAENIILWFEVVCFGMLPLCLDLLYLIIITGMQSLFCLSLMFLWIGGLMAIILIGEKFNRAQCVQSNREVQRAFLTDVFLNSVISRIFMLEPYNKSIMDKYLKRHENMYADNLLFVGSTRMLFGLVNIFFFVCLSIIALQNLDGLGAAYAISIFWQFTRKTWDMLLLNSTVWIIYNKVVSNLAILDWPEEKKNSLPELHVQTIETRNLPLVVEGKTILNNINLDIQPGDFVAIQGPSGIGKSILLKTLIGMFPVENNRVFINGIDINELNYQCILENIIYVTQNDFIYNSTVRENIELGRKDDKLLYKLCSCLNINVELLDKHCGIDGALLSGGQKRKIGLIRALFHKPNARILIIDEPFAALDVENINSILLVIVKMKGIYTIIGIDHTGYLKKHANKSLIFNALDHTSILEIDTQCQMKVTQQTLEQILG